jgi:hypothetical protein
LRSSAACRPITVTAASDGSPLLSEKGIRTRRRACSNSIVIRCETSRGKRRPPRTFGPSGCMVAAQKGEPRSDAFASIDRACSIPEEAINRSTVQPDVRTARGRFGLVSVPVSVRHRKWPKSTEAGRYPSEEKTLCSSGILLEAAIGFEPMHGGFADLSLNHLGTPPRASSGRDRPIQLSRARKCIN